MRIIGIDPGLRYTGFAVVDILENVKVSDRVINFGNKNIQLLKTGLVKNSLKVSLSVKLSKIFNQIKFIIEEFSPNVIVLEKLYSHYTHPTTAILMGHARGVIVLAASILNVKVVSLPATRVKKSVTGRGNASKHQVNNMIKHIFNIYNIPDSYDVTDAIALVITYININSEFSNLKTG